jgi:hypothetical protein
MHGILKAIQLFKEKASNASSVEILSCGYWMYKFEYMCGVHVISTRWVIIYSTRLYILTVWQ